jgi:hypothetical protein
VWLAGVADPGLVGAQVMGALGVRQAGDMPVLVALIYRLQSAELLLVLDNCKQLLATPGPWPESTLTTAATTGGVWYLSTLTGTMYPWR